MERHPYIVTLHAYLEGIRSTVGEATLRERESKLLYLFEVMLQLRLIPDPRTMDKEEIDSLVLWMRERNLGLAYQAKLGQEVRGTPGVRREQQPPRLEVPRPGAAPRAGLT